MLQRLNAHRGRVAILNLHRVTPADSPFWPALSPAAFRRLVDHLARHCRLITLDELDTAVPSGVPSVLLSFDDGCRDFIEYAMPILAERRLRVNHNVIVESVLSEQPPWMIQVVDALNAADPEAISSLKVPGFSARPGDDRFSQARFGAQLTGHLKALPPDRRHEATASVDAMIAATDPAAFTPMMSRAEVLEMAGHHDLGCHSYSHEAMALVSDAAFNADLNRCQAFFRELGHPLDIYAFPYGSHRDTQIHTLRAAGVRRILLVGEAPAQPRAVGLTRVTMYGDSDAELQLRACGRSLRPPGLAGS